MTEKDTLLNMLYPTTEEDTLLNRNIQLDTNVYKHTNIHTSTHERMHSVRALGSSCNLLFDFLFNICTSPSVITWTDSLLVAFRC